MQGLQTFTIKNLTLRYNTGVNAVSLKLVTMQNNVIMGLQLLTTQLHFNESSLEELATVTLVHSRQLLYYRMRYWLFL